MNKNLKQTVIKLAIENIQSLNATDFEIVSHNCIALLENKPLLHRGLNKHGNPAGYTVDSFDDAREIVGEYSTEPAYFTKDDKIQNDINHAIAQTLTLKKLYLVANQECPNGRWKNVKSIADSLLKNKNVEYRIFDSRRLAESIVDILIKNTNYYDKFTNFIPYLENLRNSQCFSNAIPQFQGYIENPGGELALERIVDDAQLILIHGISGSGKSFLANWYAKKHCTEDYYDNIYWINGQDLNNISTFSDTPIYRLGYHCNFSAIFNMGKNLLIVDSLEDETKLSLFEQLKKGCDAGGKVIITSQIDFHSFTGAKLPLSGVDKKCALALLDLFEDNEEGIIFAKMVGMHPLVLNTASTLIKKGFTTLKELSNDVSTLLECHNPANTTITIYDRIIGKIPEPIKKSLKKLLWTKAIFFDADFLKSFCKLHFFELIQYSILSEIGPDLYKVHDLIYSSVSIQQEDSWKDEFKAYFCNKITLSDCHFQRTLQFCSKKIFLLANENDSLFVYLYLLVDGERKDKDFVDAIAQNNIYENCDNILAVQAIFEAREIMYFEFHDDFSQKSQEEIQKVLTQTTSLNNSILHTIYHHYGKILKRIHKDDDACIQFRKALEYEANAPHSLLQLARLTKNSDEKQKLIYQIIGDNWQENFSNTSITTFFAAFELIVKDNSKIWNDFQKRYPDFQVKLCRIIQTTYADGYSQPFQLIARLGQKLWYNNPCFVVSLMASVNIPSDNMIQTAESSLDFFDWAEILKNYAKAQKELGFNQAAVGILNQAVELYEKKLKCSGPNQYRTTMYAECLILLKRFDYACEILNFVKKEERGIFWFHRYAQALNGLNLQQEALNNINHALKILTDAQTIYKSAFLEVKSDCLWELEHYEEALAVLEEAIELSNDKYQTQLITKRNNFKNYQQNNN